MGLLAWRKRKIIESGRQRGLIGKGEIRAMVLAQTDLETHLLVPTGQYASAGKVHAVIATDSKLCVLPIPGWSTPDKPVYKAAIGEAEVRYERGQLVIDDTVYEPLFFTKRDTRQLVDFVAERRAESTTH